MTHQHPQPKRGTKLCKLHPKYKAIRPPTSTKPGCTCQEAYKQAHCGHPAIRKVHGSDYICLHCEAFV